MSDTREHGVQPTEDKLYIGDTGDLAALLATLLKNDEFPGEAFVLAENLPMHTVTGRQARENLLYFTRVKNLRSQNDDGQNIDIGSYTSGRIFCKQFELRWQQRRDGSAYLIYTGPARLWRGLIPVSLTEKEQFAYYQPRRYYLFGEILREDSLREMGLPLEDDDKSRLYYAEVRIPRLLRYPIPEGAGDRRRLQLVVSEYLTEGTEEVSWFRFRDLKPEKGEQA